MGISYGRQAEDYSGLYGKRFVGYFNDDVNWFDTATLHGDTNQTTEISFFTSSADNYSWMWVGVFKAPESGTFTFYTGSDDASFLWVGQTAISGFTTANATVNNGGLHGYTEQSGNITLEAGKLYPIRLMFGESGGGDAVSLLYQGPTIAKTSNGDGVYFGGLYFWERYVGL